MQRVLVTMSLFFGRAISIVTIVSAILRVASTEYEQSDSFNNLSSSLSSPNYKLCVPLLLHTVVDTDIIKFHISGRTGIMSVTVTTDLHFD